MWRLKKLMFPHQDENENENQKEKEGKALDSTFLLKVYE